MEIGVGRVTVSGGSVLRQDGEAKSVSEMPPFGTLRSCPFTPRCGVLRRAPQIPQAELLALFLLFTKVLSLFSRFSSSGVFTHPYICRCSTNKC